MYYVCRGTSAIQSHNINIITIRLRGINKSLALLLKGFYSLLLKAHVPRFRHMQQHVLARDVKPQYLNHLAAGSFQYYLILISNLSLREEDFLSLSCPCLESSSLQNPQKHIAKLLGWEMYAQVFFPSCSVLFLRTCFY